MIVPAFGNNTLSKSRTFHFYWFIRFKEGLSLLKTTSVRSYHSRKPSDKSFISETVDMFYKACKHTLPDEINMRRIAAKFVPQLWTLERRDGRVHIWTSKTDCRKFKWLIQGYYWWWKLGVLLRVGNQVSLVTLEDTNLSWWKKTRNFRRNVNSLIEIYFNILGIV